MNQNNQRWLCDKSLLKRSSSLIQQEKFTECCDLLYPYIKRNQFNSPTTFGHSFDRYLRSYLATAAIPSDAISTISSLCQFSTSRYGQQPWTDLYYGCSEFIQGNIESAEDYFLNAATNPKAYLRSSIGCQTVRKAKFRRSLAMNNLEKIFSWAPEIKWHGRQSNVPLDSEVELPILLIVCDDIYFRKYADSFISSTRKISAVTLIHLHFINPSVESEEFIKLQRRAGKWSNLNLTTEVYEGLYANNYCSVVRYIRLPFLIRYYKRPVIVSDIDATLVHDIDSYASTLASFDVVLRMKKFNVRSFPWQVIQAGMTYVRNSQSGIKFATFVAKYIAGVFDPFADQDFFFLDQNALYYAYYDLCLEAKGVRHGDFLSGYYPQFLKFRQEESRPRIGLQGLPSPVNR